MIYFAILIYTLVLFYQYDLKQKQTGIKIHYRILLIATICIVGFSYRLGMDTTGYMQYFESVSPDLSYTFNNLLECRYEPIPELLFSLCKRIWDDFALVQIVVGIFVNTTIFWFLRKHSPMFFFSVFLYYIFQYWNLNFEIKRESIAVCIFLIAIDKILKEDAKFKDYLIYYGICIIAILAHRFAFITFFYPIFQNLKFSKIYIGFISLSFLIFILYSSFVSRALYTFNGLIAFSSGEAIQEYLDSSRFGAGGFSILGIVHQIILPLIIAFNTKRILNRKIYSFALLYFVVVLLKTQVFIFYRITNYLFLFVFIVYAYFLKEALANPKSSLSHNNTSMSIVKSKLIIKYILYFIILFHIYTLTAEEQHIRYMPYNSIFQKELNKERENVYNDLDLMLNY